MEQNENDMHTQADKGRSLPGYLQEDKDCMGIGSLQPACWGQGRVTGAHARHRDLKQVSAGK